MSIDFAHRARELLEGAGLPVTYHESDGAHHIDPAHLEPAREWLRGDPGAGLMPSGRCGRRDSNPHALASTGT